MSDPAIDLAHSVRRGSLAIVACQLASHVASVAVLAVLYRLLGPDPFGLLGLIVPLVAFGRIFTTGGLYVAGVQQADLAAAQASALFWLNQALGLAAALAVAAAAPLLAWLHGRPEVLPLGLALAGTLWASTWGLQHQVQLERQMRIGAVAAVRMVALVSGGAAAIALAWQGCGVWALVAQQYVEWTATAAFFVWLCTWRPEAPRRGADVWHLIRVGRNYTASGVLFWAAANVDKLLVGWLFDPRTLGFYYQAYNLAMKPVHALSAPLTGVMLPALSRARDDRALFLRLLSGFWRLIALLSFPLGMGLILTAPEAMLLLGSQRWIDAGPMLQVFAALILVHLFINVIGSVLSAAGHSRRLVIQAALLAAGVFVALAAAAVWPGHEAYTFAIAYTAAYLVVAIPSIAGCLKAIEMPLGAFWEAIRRPALAAAAMTAAVLAVRFAWPGFADLPVAARFSLLVAAGAATYVALVRGELRWLAAMLSPPRASQPQ